METTITYQDPRKRKQIAFNIIIALLLLLWVPVSIDKIIDFTSFKDSILNQPFSNDLGYVLIYTLPALELLIAFALVSEKFLRIGLILSTLLMAVFTGYIGVALLGAWEKLPCGCGSVISGMNWTQHFFFNLFFLVLSISGLYLWYKLRGGDVGNRTTEGGSAKRQYKIFVNSKF